MVLVKIKFTNLETNKTKTLQKTFTNVTDAEYWLNNFNSGHIKIHNTKIISGKEYINLKLKQARKRAERKFRDKYLIL